MKVRACLWICLYIGILLCPAGRAFSADAVSASAQQDDSLYDPFEGGAPGEGQKLVADPFEKFNRGMFTFNDKLYYWLLKPASRGYGYVVPEPARRSVKRFFVNLATPIRLVNCLLQGKFSGAGSETMRFLVNTTAGLGGFFDPAYYCFELKRYDEDTGRTLGRYGVGHGMYIVWPVLGPSSARDTVGMVGDWFLDPTSYLDLVPDLAVNAYERVNATSLKINEYDDFKKSAIDPYISLRTAYIQNRQNGLK